MKLLVDNNLPPKLARGLAELYKDDHEIVHIRQKFGTGSLTDEQWIERLGAEGGWSVLTGDRRIATKRPSRELFLRAGLVGFFLAPSVAKMPLNRLAARLLVLWPLIEVQAGIVSAGCFEVSASGSRLRSF